MQVVDDKAIILRTKRPHLVTEAIERCKVLSEEDGMTFVKYLENK